MLYLQVWRYSTLANFYLHRIASGDSTISQPRTHPILEPSSPPLTSLALFSPTQHHLAYVHANDLYILPASRIDMDPKDREEGWEGEAIRITKDGSQTVMSGRPSWVYEEEVGRPDLPYCRTSAPKLKVVRPHPLLTWDRSLAGLLLRLDPLVVPLLVTSRLHLVRRIRSSSV